mgnify:CR=1 FL=1
MEEARRDALPPRVRARKDRRFSEDMGFVFLSQMSEILAARLSALLNPQG